MSTFNQMLSCLMFLGLLPTQEKGKELITVFESTFKQQNPELIKPYLSKTFSIGVYQRPFTDEMVTNIINYYKHLESISFIRSQKCKLGHDLFFTCKIAGREAFNSYMTVNKNGLIERVHFFDQLYGFQFEENSKLIARIPFQLADSRMIVKMKINDSPRLLNMLFDTGADGIGLKKATADEIDVIETRKQVAQVVGTSVHVGVSERNTIVLDSLRIHNQTINIFPDYNEKWDGLFGASFLKKYITYIDFENSVIELYSFGSMKYPEKFTKIDLEFSGSLAGIISKVKLNSGKELSAKLRFDTGANYSVIFFGSSVNQNDLTQGFKVQARGTTVSLGNSTPTVTGLFDHIDFGKYRINNFSGTLQTYSTNSKSFNNDGDGSLGIEIIKKFNWYINIADRELYYCPNGLFNHPTPFFLGETMLSVSNGQIYVQQVKQYNSEETLNLIPGDVIVSINEKTAKDIENPKTVKLLQEELKANNLDLIVNRNGLEFIVQLPME